MLWRRKTWAPGRKNLSPHHSLKNSTRMNSCSTWMTIIPPSLYLPMYLSLQAPASNQLHESFLHLASWSHHREPPMESHQRIWIWIWLLTFPMSFFHSQGLCLWMRKVFTKSQSKEWMRWKREVGTWFFSKKNVSLLIQRIGFTLLTPLGFLGFVQSLSEAFCHASQLCVCVHAGRLAMISVIAKYRDCATHDLFTP